MQEGHEWQKGHIYIPNNFVQIKYKLHLRCHFKQCRRLLANVGSSPDTVVWSFHSTKK